MVFQKRRIKDDNPIRLKFVLPLEVTTIYKKGLNRRGTKNLCTDSNYNSEGDHFYFWNPYKYRCPLKSKDLLKVNALLEPMESTTNTFPRYKKLFGDNLTIIDLNIYGYEHTPKDIKCDKNSFLNDMRLMVAFPLKSVAHGFGDLETVYRKNKDSDFYIKEIHKPEDDTIAYTITKLVNNKKQYINIDYIFPKNEVQKDLVVAEEKEVAVVNKCRVNLPVPGSRTVG